MKSSFSHSSTNKIAPLESLRGIAAFIVFAGHFVLGFLPHYHGVAPGGIEGKQLQESPLFFFFNGSGWVTFFFVLSGFVLSYRFYSLGNNKGLAHSLIKRWPRLFPLALISTLLSFVLIKFGLYSYFEASQITKSDWMSKLAWSVKGGVFEISFWEAFTQGFFVTFFRGDNFLNTSLWTMHYEFIGSLIVFGMIPLFNGQSLLTGFIMYLVSLAVIIFSPISEGFIPLFMIPFISGCFFSFYLVQIKSVSSPKGHNSLFFFLGLVYSFFALGFLSPAKGFYEFLNTIPNEYLMLFQICIHSTASLILIYYAINHRVFSRVLDNCVGRFLGRISFALYIIHVPIMLSLSTSLFLKLLMNMSYNVSVVITFIITLPILLFVSWLLSLLDEKWCSVVNKAIKHI